MKFCNNMKPLKQYDTMKRYPLESTICYFVKPDIRNITIILGAKIIPLIRQMNFSVPRAFSVAPL